MDSEKCEDDELQPQYLCNLLIQAKDNLQIKKIRNNIIEDDDIHLTMHIGHTKGKTLKIKLKKIWHKEQVSFEPPIDP